MKQSVSFSGKDYPKPSMDFHELRAKGLEYIQKLSGEKWTDYNLHDPGVTILDQLCYALTDLAYRSTYPIEELLVSPEDNKINALKNAFFAPSQIFSTHPVTTIDARKMLIDQFDEIQNAWIIPRDTERKEEGMRGLSKVEVLPWLTIHDQLESDHQRKKLSAKIKDFLRTSRNIGEDYDEVTVLDSQEVWIDFEVHVTKQDYLEATIASLFLDLYIYLYKPVHFYDYQEMSSAGYSVQEIYAGPRLHKGFIKNEELGERIKVLDAEELDKICSKGTGVEKCDILNLSFIDENGREIESGNKLRVKPDNFFRVITGDNPGNIFSSIKVFLNRKRVSFNKEKVRSMLTEKWSKRYREYHLTHQVDILYKEKLTASWRNPKKYFSIQNHFPRIYGIGPDGISKKEPADRHARAKQLKAYLMFFERHLADHLAQLGSLDELFNIDFKDGQKQSYFSQKLSTVPGLENIQISKLDNQNIHESSHIFHERKSKIYDHLLARFGEELQATPWEIAQYHNMIASEEQYFNIVLSQKSRFLLDLQELNYEKNKGESFIRKRKKTSAERNPSGLERILSLKTGIPETKESSLIPKFNLEGHHLEKEQEITLSEEDFRGQYRSLTGSERKITFEKQEDSMHIPIAIFGRIGIKELFKRTLRFQNYLISKEADEVGKSQVIFRKRRDVWVKLFKARNDEVAVYMIHQIIAYFRRMNLASEGCYIVDHIQLKNILNESRCGFKLLDEYGRETFSSPDDESWNETPKDREQLLKQFYKAGLDTASYHIRGGKVDVRDEHGKVLASCDLPYKDQKQKLKELIHQTKSIIKLYKEDVEDGGILRFNEVEMIRMRGTIEGKKVNQRKLVLQRKLPNGQIISEDFFDFRISIILPNWPVRFQDERFKSFFTDLVYERCPAHIQNDIYWLDPLKLRAFEAVYDDWVQTKLAKKGENDIEQRKQASLKLYYQMISLAK